MKVLISDNLGEIGIRMFEEEEGIEVDVNTGLPPEEPRCQPRDRNRTRS